eukprot:36575-Hanusia_phi.AAC.1
MDTPVQLQLLQPSPVFLHHQLPSHELPCCCLRDRSAQLHSLPPARVSVASPLCRVILPRLVEAAEACSIPR